MHRFSQDARELHSKSGDYITLLPSFPVIRLGSQVKPRLPRYLSATCEKSAAWLSTSFRQFYSPDTLLMSHRVRFWRKMYRRLMH